MRKPPPEVGQLRCNGCGRLAAFASNAGSIRNRIYCSEWCATQPAPSPTDERDELMRGMHLEWGMNALAIAKFWGITHANVYRILKKARP